MSWAEECAKEIERLQAWLRSQGICADYIRSPRRPVVYFNIETEEFEEEKDGSDL